MRLAFANWRRWSALMFPTSTIPPRGTRFGGLPQRIGCNGDEWYLTDYDAQGNLLETAEKAGELLQEHWPSVFVGGAALSGRAAHFSRQRR